MEMPKVYDPKSFEKRIYENWERRKYFAASVDKNKKPFTIVMPPPNITGQLHMGHALDNTLQDLIIRHKRMKGFSALWQPGTDHASIATEAKICERLKKEGTSKESLGREGFLKRAWQWKEKYGGRIVEQLKSIGASCDWDRLAFTMDEKCSRAVSHVFVDLYNKGLIYRGDRIINWCPKCKTALSDAEVEYQLRDGNLWYIKYFVKDGGKGCVGSAKNVGNGDNGAGNESGKAAGNAAGEYITVATTRPETMLGDTAVCVHPSDKRYKRLIGKTLILPVANREIKVIADAYVDMSFGTGAVKITPAHDPNDFEIGLRHSLDTIRVINDDGTMNALCGASLAGLDRYAARKKIIDTLNKSGNLLKTEPHNHNVGQCYRCASTVEPIVSKQWFVKMETLAPPAIEAVKSEKIKFIPKRFDKIYFNWMNNIKDWCISRQLWWGHRIPAYYCEKCGEAVVSPSAPAKCPSCGAGSGAAAFRQDDDVLDTWFSSALWPFSTLGFPNDSEDLSYFYPTDVLVTAYDIIFFWVARMIFSGLEQTGKPPFKDVFIHGIIRDELGRKMSKSLGNGIDPMEIIEKYGADTLRLSLVSGVSSGGDMRFSTEKIEGCRNFINKLWNASRYVLLNSEKIKIKPLSECALNNADKWILSKFNDTAKRANAGIEKYEFGAAAATLQEFVRSDFCDWYIELSKPMLYSEQDEKRNDTLNVLSYVLKGILKLLHPFIPFVTEEIYLNLPEAEDTLMLSRYPEFDKKLSFSGAAAETEKLTAAISAIRNVRTQNNVPDNRRVDMLVQTGIAKKRFEDYRLYVEKLCNCKLETVNGGANAAAVNGVVGKAASAATDAKETGAKVSGSKRVNKKATVTKGGIAANGEGANTAAKTEATGGAASAKNVEIITEIGRFIIPLKNLVDFGRERERLQKEIELSRAELDRARQKLSNAGFTGKAPKVLIDAEKEKAEKFKTQIKRLEEQLKNF